MANRRKTFTIPPIPAGDRGVAPGVVDPEAVSDFVSGSDGNPAEDRTAVDERAQVGFFDYLRKLSAGVLQSSTIYWYRLEPKIKNLGSNSYIAKCGAEGCDEEWLKEKFGGGKYRAWLNTPNEANDIQRVVSIAGPAKIYPDQILVDADGKPLSSAPAAAPGAQPVTQDTIAQIVKEAIQAVKEKGAGADEALSQAMGLFRKAQEGSIEILTSTLKDRAAGNSETQTTALLKELLTELRTQRNPSDRKVDKLIDAAIDRMVNPPASEKPKSLLEQLKELKELAEMGEGGGGVLGAILGGSARGEGAWWEPVVGKLAEAVSETIKANAPSLIEAYREKIRVDAFLAQQRGRPAGAPGAPEPAAAATAAPSPAAPALPIPSGPAALPIPIPAGPGTAPPDFPGQIPVTTQHPAAAPAAAKNTAVSAEDAEVFKIIQKQITELIVTCWEEQDSGADAAVTVKRAHRQLLPLIRPHFQDFNQVLALAAADPVLGQIAKDPEFPEWAREFHAEFLTDEPAA